LIGESLLIVDCWWLITGDAGIWDAIANQQSTFTNGSKINNR
jgi:hypothetical protein